jgi:hypothetical protein
VKHKILVREMPRVAHFGLLSAALLLCTAPLFSQSTGETARVYPAFKHDRSLPLREMKPASRSYADSDPDDDADGALRVARRTDRDPAQRTSEVSPDTERTQLPGTIRHRRDVFGTLNHENRAAQEASPTDVSTDVVHAKMLSAAGPSFASPSLASPSLNVAPGLNMEGLFTFGARATPDTSGAVGATQYVQWVNLSFAVFDKASGTMLYGPAFGSTLWTGFGGPCEQNNDGDIVAEYDKAAARWVMSQHAVSGGPPFLQCVAVSQTSDATGSWNRYAFTLPNDFPDYPKLGVWSDAYYLTINEQDPTTYANLGANVCALDRQNMLLGNAASMQCFQLATTYQSLLPSDLDGSLPPPQNSPNYLLNMGTNALRLWKFHVDWQTPANTTLTGPVNIPVASFTKACSGSGFCVPQTGTSQLLDGIGDRLMYRLAYRNFPDGHESLVVSHSVSTPSAIRWYEIQNPGGTPEVFQQGTFAPDSNYRWMPSIGMDQMGDIAVGYSVSSSSMTPAIRYTGREQSDPLNTMQSENSIFEGPAFQQGSNRWGDYSSMSIDPIDDCTFYYTNQYQPSNGSHNWHTRIASFKFPSCTSTPLVTVSPNRLTFGAYPVGVTSQTDTVIVTNNQAVPLNISGIAASGDFSSPTNTCGSGLAAHASCNVSVTFTPTTTGIRTGQLTINDDAAGSPQVINLTGTGGGGPLVSLSPSSLGFKSPPQTTTASKTITLTNMGSGALTVNSVVASGDYSLTTTCVGSIAPSGVCSVNVSFTPTVTGTILGEVTITDNAIGSPHLVNLSGVGLTTLAVAPPSLTFASTSVGSSTATQMVTITNNASTSQTVSYAASGNFTAVPGGSTPCGASQPVTLNSGLTCTLSVGFSPTSNGTIKGSVTVTDAASGVAYNPQLVSLTGTGFGGTTPALSGLPATLGFGSVVVGSSFGTKTITVYNTSGSPVSILGLVTSGDFALALAGSNRCAANTTILQPGKSCKLSVTVAPTATGSLQGSITLTDNAAAGPTTQVFGLSVTGVWPVSLSPGRLTFSPQGVGTTSTAQIVTVSNYSGSVVALNSIVPSGNFAFVAGGSSPCGTSIPAAIGQQPGTCTFGVTFTPTASGVIKGVISVSHNAAGNNSPQIVSLTGTGQ